MEHPAEQQPLLLPSDDGELRSQDNELPERERAQQPNQALTFTFLGLILLTIGVSRCLITDATSRLERETICHQFLSSNGSSGYNNGCRDSGGNLAPEVVFELGFIHFWDNTLTLLPGILVALPFGVLADTYSRKNILTISVCGILLSQAFRAIVYFFPSIFPLRLVLLSSALKLIGGGHVTFFAVVFAIAANILEAARMSLVFLYLGAATVFGGILGQLLAYNLQQIDQRISTCIGLVVLGICLCLTVFVPDSTQEPSYEPASSAGDEPSNLDIAKNVARVLGSVLRQTFWDHWRLGAFLLTVLLATVFEGVPELSVAFANYGLLSVLLVWTALLLPGLIVILRFFSPGFSDLWPTLIILFIALIGTLVSAFGADTSGIVSPKDLVAIVLIPIANTYPYLVRSLVAQFTRGRNIACLYCLIGIFESLSILTKRPLYIWLLKIGDGWEPRWRELPEVGDSVLFGLSLLILVFTWARHSE